LAALNSNKKYNKKYNKNNKSSVIENANKDILAKD
jgi:hypothetical protein